MKLAAPRVGQCMPRLSSSGILQSRWSIRGNSNSSQSPSECCIFSNSSTAPGSHSPVPPLIGSARPITLSNDFLTWVPIGDFGNTFGCVQTTLGHLRRPRSGYPSATPNSTPLASSANGSPSPSSPLTTAGFIQILRTLVV